MIFLNEVSLHLIYSFASVLVLFYLTFVYRKWKYLKFSWQVKNGFWYPILPLIGTAYVSLFSGSKNIISLMQWIDKNKGFPFSLWYGDSYIYITTNPQEIKTIVNHQKSLNKAPFYDKFKFIFEHTIIFVPAETWKKQRKHFTAGFKPNILKNNVQVYYKHSCQMVEELKSIKSPKDLFRYFDIYAFTNFFLANSGMAENIALFDAEKIGNYMLEIQELLKSLLVNPFIHPKLWLTFFPAGRRISRILKEVRVYVIKAMDEKKKLYKEKYEYSDAKEPSLLDLCLTQNSEFLDDDKIIQHVELFAAAASDTSGHSLAFTFVLLAMYPEIQENLYKEIMEIVGDNEITHQNLPNLQYTNAVVYESLRLFPVLPTLGRRCDEDIDLGTKIIPKGSSCMISLFHVHRDPQYWSNPLEFKPSRFFTENIFKINPFSYIPFSAGSRDCIGKAQALIMMKVTVANVIRNFRITSTHKSIKEFTLESCLSMKTTNKLDCHFYPRANV